MSQLECPSKRPRALSVWPGGIPDALKARPQWVLWRYDVSAADEWAKVCYRTDARRRACSNRPATWGSYEQAFRAYKRGGFDGVGYVFSPDDPFAGVDLDDCRQPRAGRIDEHAQKVLDLLDGYAEVSPSGTGVKVIVEAKKPASKCLFKAPDGRRVEVYEKARYFAVTGRRLGNSPADVVRRQEQLDALFEKNFLLPKASLPVRAIARVTVAPVQQSVEQRAEAYLRKCPPAVSGAGGHGVTFAVARVVVYGFDLGFERGLELMSRVYNPTCRPPWSEAELKHKCEQADSVAFSKPRGWML